MSRVTVMPTVHVMVAVIGVGLSAVAAVVGVIAVSLVPAVATVSAVLFVAAMALVLIMVRLRTVGLVCVSVAVIRRFVRGTVGGTGMRGVAVLVVIGTLLVRTVVLVLLLLLMSTVVMLVLLLVVTPDTVPRLRAVGFRAVMAVALPVHLRIRKPAPPKLGEPTIERGGDLLRFRDPNPCLWRRYTAPDIRDPVASVATRITDDHEQIRFGRQGHARPSPPRQLSLDREALTRGTRAQSQQNSGPGHRPPYQPAPQLHRKAPSRQA
jgi:hypothetical protein